MGFNERRKGKDILLRLLTGMALVGWSLILVALFVIDQASPQDIEVWFSYIDTGQNTYVGSWNEQLLQIVFYIMLLGMFISIVGLFLNSKRNRRRNDNYYLSLIFLGIVSTIGTLYLLV